MKKILLFCLTICFLTVKAQNVSITIDEPLPVCNPGDPTTLNANYIQTKTTTNNYTVTSIPYAPFYSTTGGTLLPAFTVDDNWSASISLPFKFCFFGQNYNSVIVGSNGVVHFQDGSQTPGGACAWSYSGTIPNAAFPIKNAIYGVYQDTDIRTPPVTAGNELVQCVNYYITGTAPNRVFVANFNQLPLFSCNSSMGMQTSQVILYETTNAIDVLVTRRTSCTSWNGGLGVIGIQNSAGTIAYTPAGRNSGTWSTTNEAWRFRPNAVNNTTLTWLANGVPIPSTTNVNPITVNPTACTNYTAQVDYLQCDGTNTTITATRTVCPEANLPVLNPQNITQCATVPPIPSFNINQNAYMLNGASASDYSFIYHIGTQSGTVIPTGSLGTYTPASLPQTIWVEITDQNTTGCTNFRSFVINAVASPSGTFSYSSPFCNSIITDQLPILNALTSGGAFSSVPPTGLALTASTGAIDPSTSTPGTYTVKYHINATGSCPAYDAPDVTVTILASPPAPTVTTPVTYCQNATASALIATGTGLLWYTVATGGTGSTTAPTPSTATAGSVTYYVSQTVSGCESLRAAIVVTVTAAPSAPAVSTPVNYCQNETASALTATGTGLLWYTVATGGTGSTTAPTPSTATVGSVTYYVSQTVSGCESPRAAIVVNVTALPAAPTVTSPVNYCQNATASA
ncbi:MAG: hypothetical protein QM535_14210, partial [Limnohabitans sp.]|nr:hypothetical protein [Limnohabitans sp.]